MFTEVQYEILDGPSTDRLIDCFKYATTPDVTLEVEFTLIPRNSRLKGKLGHKKLSAVVTGLQYESGAPGMFIIWVNIQGLPKHTQDVRGGFYNANERKGFLTFQVPADHLSKYLA